MGGRCVGYDKRLGVKLNLKVCKVVPNGFDRDFLDSRVQAGEGGGMQCWESNRTN